MLPSWLDLVFGYKQRGEVTPTLTLTLTHLTPEVPPEDAPQGVGVLGAVIGLGLLGGPEGVIS